MNLSRRLIREGGELGKDPNHDAESCTDYSGASGIGKSTAMILDRKGINVVISGRREGLGEKAVEEIRAQGDGDAAFIAADVDDEAQVRGMVQFAMKTYGRLDLAVNNAGISNETKNVGPTTHQSSGRAPCAAFDH